MILITTILFGLARGQYEGMIMMPGGVRLHEAFWLYHALGLAMFIAAGYLVYLMIKRQDKITPWYILGLLFVMWECTEIGYSCSRFGYIKAYEHVVFADIIDFTISGWQVWTLHATRIIASLYFIITGGK